MGSFQLPALLTGLLVGGVGLLMFFYGRWYERYHLLKPKAPKQSNEHSAEADWVASFDDQAVMQHPKAVYTEDSIRRFIKQFYPEALPTCSIYGASIALCSGWKESEVALGAAIGALIVQHKKYRNRAISMYPDANLTQEQWDEVTDLLIQNRSSIPEQEVFASWMLNRE